MRTILGDACLQIASASDNQREGSAGCKALLLGLLLGLQDTHGVPWVDRRKGGAAGRLTGFCACLEDNQVLDYSMLETDS